MQIKYRLCAFVVGVAGSASRLLSYPPDTMAHERGTRKGFGGRGVAGIPPNSKQLLYMDRYFVCDLVFNVFTSGLCSSLQCWKSYSVLPGYSFPNQQMWSVTQDQSTQ